ncbi:hypothetical protein EV361DRAFT_984502 [Lentinula raphanica]|nr:hypothetical protein EV361DRAFT_984502 [Lentinula raphanica]
MSDKANPDKNTSSNHSKVLCPISSSFSLLKNRHEIGPPRARFMSLRDNIVVREYSVMAGTTLGLPMRTKAQCHYDEVISSIVPHFKRQCTVVLKDKVKFALVKRRSDILGSDCISYVTGVTFYKLRLVCRTSLLAAADVEDGTPIIDSPKSHHAWLGMVADGRSVSPLQIATDGTGSTEKHIMVVGRTNASGTTSMSNSVTGCQFFVFYAVTNIRNTYCDCCIGVCYAEYKQLAFAQLTVMTMCGPWCRHGKILDPMTQIQ